MKSILSNKMLQATYGGDVMGGSVCGLGNNENGIAGVLPHTLLSLTRIFSWMRIYFGKPALPSIVNSLQGFIGEKVYQMERQPIFRCGLPLGENEGVEHAFILSACLAFALEKKERRPAIAITDRPSSRRADIIILP